MRGQYLVVCGQMRVGQSEIYLDLLTYTKLVWERLVVDDVHGPLGGQDQLDRLHVEPAAALVPGLTVVEINQDAWVRTSH